MKVQKRKESVKLEAKGNFPGARVVRGPDWDWGNQDGKLKKKGLHAIFTTTEKR